MGNIATSNPIFVDTAAAIWTGTKNVKLVQWVDDNGDLVHDSTLTLTVNSIQLTFKIQPVNDQLAFGAVAWQFGPFQYGVPWTDLTVDAMNEGHLHIWIS